VAQSPLPSGRDGVPGVWGYLEAHLPDIMLGMLTLVAGGVVLSACLL